MKTRTRLAALAVVGLTAVAPALASSFAADTATAVAPVSAEPTQILRTSDDVRQAMGAIRAARVALFEGQTDQAMGFADEAVKNLMAAKADAGALVIATQQAADPDVAYVPFESSISLAEGFTPTDAMIEEIKEASGYLAAGDEKKAVETLVQADVQMIVAAALLPIDDSVSQAEAASNLIAEGSFYGANLALKAIEDSVLLDFYPADTVPTQGKTG